MNVDTYQKQAARTLIGVPMSDVMQANIDKLKKRFPEGWGSEAIQSRGDTQV